MNESLVGVGCPDSQNLGINVIEHRSIWGLNSTFNNGYGIKSRLKYIAWVVWTLLLDIVFGMPEHCGAREDDNRFVQCCDSHPLRVHLGWRDNFTRKPPIL